MRKIETSQLPFIPSICFSLLLGGNFLWRHRSTNEVWCDRNLHLTWKTEQRGSSGELRGCKMLSRRSPFYVASRVQVMFNEWIQCCYCVVAVVVFLACFYILSIAITEMCLMYYSVWPELSESKKGSNSRWLSHRRPYWGTGISPTQAASRGVRHHGVGWVQCLLWWLT